MSSVTPDPCPNTRTRILEASWKLLETRPYSSVRMSDIARRAGISRQALYLHFGTRAELLIATTRYIDRVKNVDARLQASRMAATGRERLVAFVDAWGNYIPEIYGVGKALLAMRDSDEAAALAWDDRMRAVREACEAIVRALETEGALAPDYSPEQATDLLWSLLSVRHWEQLTLDCGWSQRVYIETLSTLTQRILAPDGSPRRAGKRPGRRGKR